MLVAAGGEEEDEGVIGGGQQQVRALDNQRESFRVVQLVLASVDGCNRSRVSFACNCVRWERSQGAPRTAAAPLSSLVARRACPLPHRQHQVAAMDKVYLDLRGKRLEIERDVMLSLPESVLL